MKKRFIKTTFLSVLSLSILGACSSSVDQGQDAGLESKVGAVNQAAGIERVDRVEVAATIPLILNDAPQPSPQTGEGSKAAKDIHISASVSTASRHKRHELEEIQVSSSYNLSRIAPGEISPVRERRETYASLADNRIKQVAESPVSTFSIDVDTASYSNVRRFLNDGQLPPADAVRTEELINYFSYQYPDVGAGRSGGGQPFSIFTEVSASPWADQKHLLHIGLQAIDPLQQTAPSANLVFLVDVSGSMNSPDKLDLLKTSLKLLVKQMDEQDRVSLVVYAGASGVVLEPVAGSEQGKIIAALERLSSGGSTNGAAGIELAYEMAQSAYIEGGINRVILATDGDFNVGISNVEDLKSLIAEKRQSGISLTTLGFGRGNINDHLMEQLADSGDGNYAYIDTLNEARKVLVDEMSSTLHTVARDVKIQIEFNPAVVAEYRLVGYENRLLQRADFNNDKIDAGEIGVGHTVTALYEISLTQGDSVSVDPLRYGEKKNDEVDIFNTDAELAFLKLRYKTPETDTSELIEYPLLTQNIASSFGNTSENFKFSAAVAGFSQLLKQDASLENFDFDDVVKLALATRGEDAFGYRAEFINLVRTAQALQ